MAMHRPAVILACLAWSLLLPAGAWAQSKELEGWASGDQWAQAVEHAQETGKPIVVIQHVFDQSKETDKVAWAWASNRGLRGMVPIHFKSTAQDKGYKQAADQANDEYKYGPKLYIFDPQLRLVGYRNYRHKLTANEALAVAGHVLKWQKGVERDLAKADQFAEAGRISAALKVVDDIAAQDIKSTYAVQLLTVSAAEGETPTRPEPPTAGWFYPDLVPTQQALFAAKADARIAEAERLYQDLKHREALAVIRPLASDTSDLPQVEKAKELQAQITESLKAEAS